MLNEHVDIVQGAPPACATDDGLAAKLADLAGQALFDELLTWPKPGLVSHIDRGSHGDMDSEIFRRSIAAIRPFLVRMAASGSADLIVLRCIGLDAEAAMMTATGGVNTHRGAIFALGLLCAAGHILRSRGDAAALTAIVRTRWGRAILEDRPCPASHGGAAMLRYGVSGARGEAALGFPSATRIGLPALRRGRRLAPAHPEAARIECVFALIATLDDTNLLHRGGPKGLAFARGQAQAFLAAGGVGQPAWCEQAASIHDAFVSRGLSPGGSADLLAVTLFLDAYEAGQVAIR